MTTSPDTLWTRVCIYLISACLAFVGITLLVHPGYGTAARSISIIHDVTGIPWRVWGGVFVACAAAIGNRCTRFYGYFGAFLVSTFFVASAVIFSVIPGEVENVIVVGLSPLGPLMFIAATRYAWKANAMRGARKRAQR